MATKLRGQGPQTFISYGFGNPLAPKLAQRLATEGFQVTLITDVTLLGQPSLAGALEERIRKAEIVVPVLDSKANQSAWVLREIELAQQYGRMILPVVQDADHLPAPIHDIPYVREDNMEALIPAALAPFGLLPLDFAKPYELQNEPLRSYLSSSESFLRVILDTDDLIGRLLDATGEAVLKATAATPMARSSIEQAVRGSLESCARLMDRAQPLLPRFRQALEDALSAYGPKRVQRSMAAWQRMIRLLVGRNLLQIASRLLPGLHPTYWGAGTAAMAEAQSQVATMNNTALWALTYRGDEAPRGWLEVSFTSGNGEEFRGYIPKSQNIALSAQVGEPPAGFLEPYQWADFGLPQVVSRAVVLADRFGDDAFTASIAWNLEEYTHSSLVG